MWIKGEKNIIPNRKRIKLSVTIETSLLKNFATHMAVLKKAAQAIDQKVDNKF